MSSISKRSRSIDSSGIRRVFDLAAQLTAPINLSIGQPDFDASVEAKQAAHAAIDQGKNGYTMTQGIPELRQRIADQYGVRDNPEVDVFVTSGVSGGLVLSYFALLDPGDEVLIPDPFFCIYRDLALLVNAVPLYYDTYPKFLLPLEKIEAAITPKTKAILLNSPGNPTGYAFSQEELDQVIALAKRKNIWVIYDEIYEALCLDGTHAQAFGRYDKTIILGGFSKSHGIPGWRAGYCLGPKEVVAEMSKIQQYTFVCAPSVFQHAIAQAFTMDEERIKEAYRQKRDFICNALAGKYKFVIPGGAFYLFPEAPGGSGQQFV